MPLCDESVFRGCDLRYASFGTRASFASDESSHEKEGKQGTLTAPSDSLLTRHSSHIVHCAISASRNSHPPRARAQRHSFNPCSTLRNRVQIAARRRVCSLCIPQRCNWLCRRAACTAKPRAPPTRRAACAHHPPQRACTNGAPSPKPHHRRAAQPSLHTHDAVTPVTRRRGAPPRVTAAPRATSSHTRSVTRQHITAAARNAHCTHNYHAQTKKQS